LVRNKEKAERDAGGPARVNVLHGPVFGLKFECPDELSARGPLLVPIWNMSLQKKKKDIKSICKTGLKNIVFIVIVILVLL